MREEMRESFRRLVAGEADSLEFLLAAAGHNLRLILSYLRLFFVLILTSLIAETVPEKPTQSA
jgi:hypothetical protein